MDTIIKKKGRIAIAWLIIVTMVFATMSTPFASAEDFSNTPKTKAVFSNYVGNVDKAVVKNNDKTIPATVDFIFIKQKSEQHDANYLWTPTEITDPDLKHDILLYLKNHDDSLKFYSDEFWSHFDNFIWGYDNVEGPGSNPLYVFSLEEIDGINYTVIDFNLDDISHIDFGNYDIPELSEYEIEVTKAITLNGGPTNPLEKSSFYIALFDSEKNMIGEKQVIEVEDNKVLGKVTFTVTDPEATYYIYEVDSSGKELKTGIEIEDYVLNKIYNQGKQITELSTSEPTRITITNNLEERSTPPESVSWTPKAMKVLEGKRLSDYAAGTFAFKLTQTNPSTNADPWMATNNKNGSITFPRIDFTNAGTYTFTMEEVKGDILGVTYDASKITVTVKVTRNSSGQLKIRENNITYSKHPIFINKYTPTVSWTPTATKVLEGKNLSDYEAGTFEFELKQTNPSTSAAPLTASNDQGGSVTFPTIYYTDDDTYEYTMEEVGELIPGVTNDLTKYNIKVEVTWNCDYPWWNLNYWNPLNWYLSAEVTYPENVTNGVPVFTNTYVGPGSITVTKKIEVTDGSGILINGPFYAGLFTKNEEGGFELVKQGDPAVDAIVTLDVVNSANATATFSNLDLNKTYYLFEVNKAVNGEIIPTDGINNNGSGNIMPLTTSGWKAIGYSTNEIELTSIEPFEATITNYFSDFGAAYDPAIEVTKIVTKNGKTDTAAPENAYTFYVGLFTDSGLTDRIAFKPLTTKAITSFVFDKDGKTPLDPKATYYIAETDEFGNPIVGTASKLGYQISINSVSNNNTPVKLLEDGTPVTITNDYIDIPKKTEEFPLTGDDSNMGLWLFLAMLGVAGAIAPFAFRKKEVAND